jgi:hypothetical protein
VSKDVAEIKLSPSTFPFRKIRQKIGAEWFDTATAHADLLPKFPFLTIGGDTQGHVRVIGFGHISPIPYKWTAEGQVDKYYHENETDFFDVRFVSPPQPGNSGSPVLNDQNQVVGLLVWLLTIHKDMATALAPSAFRNPCP